MAIQLKYVIDNTKGEFRWVRKGDLRIDTETYQRGVTKMASQIVKDGWSWPNCGVLSVAEREDGSLWVFDGGNRLEAANLIQEIEELPCMVFQSEGAEHEAGTFSLVNIDRVRLTALSKQKSLVTGGNEAAIFAERLISQAESYGCVVGKLSEILRNFAAAPKGRNQLRAIWPTLVDVYSGIKMPSSVLRGFYWIESHLENQSLSERRWVKAAKQAGPKALEEAARRGAITKNSAPNWGRGIRERLQKGIPSRHHLKIIEGNDD